MSKNTGIKNTGLISSVHTEIEWGTSGQAQNPWVALDRARLYRLSVTVYGNR